MSSVTQRETYEGTGWRKPVAFRTGDASYDPTGSDDPTLGRRLQKFFGLRSFCIRVFPNLGCLLMK